MIARFHNFLGSLPMTVVGGLFLAASLTLMLMGKEIAFDPAWITVFICGLPLLYAALTMLLFERWISSALLISIAMAASIAIGELFAAGEVAFIMALGGILEDATIARARKGIRRLIGLAPRQGRRILAGGQEETVPVEEIRPGDRLRVLPGETLPVDGTVVEGHTSIDQSVMTGESLPVDKAPGDEVFCGTVNRFGSIDLAATRIGADSSLQRMIDLVKAAEEKKAPMQRTVDRWAAWLVPTAVLIAVATWFFTGEIIRAVTVLVVFCPCALALATPTTIMAAIGQATRHGVLVKSGAALETMGRVNCVAFDKTGTLTFGNLKVAKILPLEASMDETKLLALAAAAEKRSEHPLAKAIVEAARERGLPLADAAGFRMVPGRGIEAEVEGAPLLCGSLAYLEENGVPVKNAGESIPEEEAGAFVWIARKERCLGVLILADEVRPAAGIAVKELKEAGSEVVLLTGDHHRNAARLAANIGIDSVQSGLLPEGKVEAVRRLRENGQVVCMIGDGVNDAAALKTADVGVAMGGMGSDIAVEAAEIVLMDDHIEKIPYLKRLSNATLRTVKGNIIVSMALNFIAIGLSMAGVLNPVSGALVHNAGSVLVVLNAALLYDRKFR